ncbi:S41 family peptidase [Ectothiorhodospira lacustris]|uniref:S41 family peptidase n=1 Tax=Ectothiorhodospira lacustris TaxID=2899127 RepID=UPI001EE9A2EF|nr:S41 family peptidase [Ectothiorhodospira lacustris]MCG5499691.1 S41 family peptidase [Ectothiorhodospira lacustris]MCG5509097.1 S41 family peptidase [Ectothiorhodospira lacustris]MCG5520888.1 S41 family peptidase [Ectothiorhodospira lacustris]
MSTQTRVGAGLLMGLILGVALSISFSVMADRQQHEADALPLEDLRAFTDVYMRIKRNYVEEVEDSKLLENAIRGMLSGLDPHSSYLTPSEFSELQIGTSGEFGGLGLEVGMEDGFVKIISPIDDTPASRAGIQAGDLIIRLDDNPVKGMTLNEAVNKMRGPRGSKITLTVVREGVDRPFEVTLTRDTIRVRSVRSEMLEPGFGYLRITTFQSKTAQNLVEEIRKLQRDSGGLKGLVLDLRNNPGGVLNGAVGVSDAFLTEGLIVYTEGRVSDAQFRYTASPGDVLKGAPLVVLVNQGSASASEIVAGALQDHQRGIIMGTPTFGKGSVQTILPLNQGKALKLTTARYYTPAGRSIQAEGIEPDIKLEPVTVARAETPDVRPITESQLNRHLQGREGATETSTTDDDEKEPLAQRDFQLYEALNLLKGLDILQARR